MQEERDNMNVETEKEILIEERLRLEEEKIKLSKEMEMFKERMKELYIEDMIQRERIKEKYKQESSRNESRSDYSEVFSSDEEQYRVNEVKEEVVPKRHNRYGQIA